MPDLSIVYVQWCETNEEWETIVKGRTGNYTVRFGRSAGQYAYDYSCTCPAFQYGKGKYCKHIEAVKDTHCAWNHDVIMGDFEEAPENGKCPKCGSNLRTVKLGI